MTQIVVWMTPNARKEELKELGAGEYALSVREKAKNNQANARMREVIAKHLGVPVRTVRIVVGHRGRKKRLEVVE